MRRLTLVIIALLLLATATHTRARTTCTATGFFRDSTNMTAALINPVGTVTGTVDATGCNIGVYYGPGAGGTVRNADISGANYFGVLANGDGGEVTVNVYNSNIHDIGEVPHNGGQHGVGIYLRGFFSTGGVTAWIVGNTITGYQKGGIVANGPSTSATISDNIVTGDGHVLFIAMNGIQIGYGASASVMRNRVSGNSFIGFPGDGSASGGIIVVGGAGYGTCPDGNDCQYTVNTKINDNVLSGNDVGVYLSNADASFNAPTSATNIKAVNNTISGDCFNNSYQAGVSDQGNNDKVINNKITGAGYAGSCGFSVDADPSFTNRAKVHANR
jgi:hypothetical protein